MNVRGIAAIAASLLAAALSPARPAIAAPTAEARQLAAPCLSCHRADGQDSGIPPIAGMNQSRLLQRMAEFRARSRGDQIMHVVANALTPEETAILAQYFVVHPPGAPSQ